MAPARKPTLAVWKFASCDGCQLTLLDCEDELLDVADEVEIAYFLEASSATVGRALRPVARRRLDHHTRTTSNASSEIRDLSQAPGDHRRLRHRRWDPGAAELRRRRRSSSPSSTPDPEFISTLATSTPIAAT